ncbi:14034_t:CDS:2 [Dentiscutata heterogama]|uniref:14034_t:CDS:1 n=1 Tax=Dentiscutata heterogama TaxID=1316150 RepID=A0ACA9MBV2_9GLOM|nr:14034_t:CDS:2 [Dentiscutata heterogama]
MAKHLILIIILFINFVLVSSEEANTTIYKSNDPEILNPSKEGVEHIFDLMIVILLYLVAEKIPLGIAAAILNLIFQVFVCEITELSGLKKRVEVLESKEFSSSQERVKASEPNESKESNSSQNKKPGQRNCKEFFVDLHDKMTNRRMMIKVVGICSHFLFCTIAAPDSLWIKVYLSCVAIYVTITEKLDEKLILLLGED